MIKRIVISLVVFIVLLVGFVVLRFNSLMAHEFEPPEISISEEVKNANIELGHRIFHVRNGCVDCHGEDGSGKVFIDDPAMGTLAGSNVTPHNLKDWSDEEIAIAIRYGIHKSKRSLHGMPSFDYTALSKGDTAAVIAYMRTLPEVKIDSYDNKFGPMARFLTVIGQMPIMIPAREIDLTKGFASKPEEGPTFEFGEYLAQTCVGCHGHDFKGGPIPGGDPSWPEASNLRLGANPIWTRESFSEMLKTGTSPITKQKLRLPMPIELLSQFDETETEALWLYLSTLK